MIPEYNEGQNIYLEHMTRYMFSSQFVKGKIVLDIACGSGYGSNELFKAGAEKVIGVDISRETIKYCQKKYSNEYIDFVVGDVTKIPIEDNSVDVVVSFETIEHIDEKSQKKFLEEISRVSKSDGIFIVSTPNSAVYPKGNPFHIKELNFDEFNKILKKFFSNVSIFFQDDIENSYIFSKKTILEKKMSKMVRNDRIGLLRPKENVFFVAVCSNSNIEKSSIYEYNIVSNIRPWIRFHQYENMLQQERQETSKLNKLVQQKSVELSRLQQLVQQKNQKVIKLNQIIQNKNQKIIKLRREIETMKKSKFWKLRNKYLKLKKYAKRK